MATAVPASVALAALLAAAPATVRSEEPAPPAPSGSGPTEPGPKPAGAAPGEPSAPAPPPAEPAAPAPPGEPAAAEKPAEPAPAAPPAGEAPSPSRTAQGKPGVLETSHAAVEEQLSDVVDWLDRFFGDRRFLEFGPQRSTVRWRSEVRLTDEPHAYPHTTALVDLRLPAASAWLSRAHLVLSGDRLPDEEGLPGDEGPGTEVATDQGRLELRYDLVRRPRTLFYLGGGVRFAWPPDPFARFRLRQDFLLTRSLLARITPTAFWQLSQGFGATMQLDLDQIIAGAAVLRASGGLLRSEKSRGLEWGTSLELRAPLDDRMVGALGGSMNGAERSPVAVDKYRVYTKLRADVLNHWLFAEIEPEVVWPADPLGQYRTILGVILRLEVLFVSEIAQSPPAPAPSAAPEPGPSREPPAEGPAPEVPWP